MVEIDAGRRRAAQKDQLQIEIVLTMAVDEKGGARNRAACCPALSDDDIEARTAQPLGDFGVGDPNDSMSSPSSFRLHASGVVAVVSASVPADDPELLVGAVLAPPMMQHEHPNETPSEGPESTEKPKHAVHERRGDEGGGRTRLEQAGN